MAQYIEQFKHGKKTKTSSSKSEDKSKKTPEEKPVEKPEEDYIEEPITLSTPEQPVQTTARKRDEPDFDYFEYNGGKYNLRLYIADLEYNFESWLNSRTVPDKYKPRIRTAYRNLLNGYANKTITPGLGNKSVDSTATYRNLEGGFDEYGFVLNYFNHVLLQQRAWEAPKKEKFDRTKFNEYINLELVGSPDFSGSRRNSFLNRDAYNSKTQKRGHKYRARDLNIAIEKVKQNIIQGMYDMDNIEQSELLSLLSSALTSLTNDGRLTKNEWLTLAKLGLDPEEYFYEGEKYIDETETPAADASPTEATPEATPEQPKSELLQELDAAQQINDSNYASFVKLRNKWMTLPLPTKSLGVSNLGGMISPLLSLNANYTSDNKKFINNALKRLHDLFSNYLKTHNIYSLNKNWLKQKYQSGDFGVKNVYGKYLGQTYYLIDNNWTREQTFLFLLDNYARLHKHVDPGAYFGDSKEKIIVQIDDNQGYVTILDTKAKKIYMDKITNLPQSILEKVFLRKFPWLQSASIQSNKEGGILKHQFGGEFGVPDLSVVQQEIESNRQQQIATAALQSGKTPEQYQEANRNLALGLTGVDKARGISIAMDLASVLASATGVGAAVGGGLSFGATLTQLGADLADKAVNTKETLSNFALGVGTSLLSFIPFVGGAGKAATVTNKAIKFTRNALKLIPTLAAAGVIFNPDILKTLSKVNQYGILGIATGKYTNEDLRNIATFIGALTGLTRQGIISGKKAIIKSNAERVQTNTTTYSVKTNKGELAIDKATYDKLKGVNKAEDANQILKDFKGTDEYKVVGEGAKWKLGLGEKTRFNSNSQLSASTPEYQYIINPQNMTNTGLFFYGNPNNRFSDVRMTLNYLNRPSISFNWGFRPTTPTVPENRRLPASKYGGIIEFLKKGNKTLKRKKKSSTRKQTSSTTQKSTSWRETTAENNYVTHPGDTPDRAKNLDTWIGYYDIDRMMTEVDNHPWENMTSELVRDALNSIEQILANNSKLFEDRSLDYTEFNTAFDKTGFNRKFFGADSAKFKYLGPTTFNRYLFYEALKEFLQLRNKGITINGKVVNFKNGKWGIEGDPAFENPAPDMLKRYYLEGKPDELFENADAYKDATKYKISDTPDEGEFFIENEDGTKTPYLRIKITPIQASPYSEVLAKLEQYAKEKLNKPDPWFHWANKGALEVLNKLLLNNSLGSYARIEDLYKKRIRPALQIHDYRDDIYIGDYAALKQGLRQTGEIMNYVRNNFGTDATQNTAALFNAYTNTVLPIQDKMRERDDARKLASAEKISEDRKYNSKVATDTFNINHKLLADYNRDLGDLEATHESSKTAAINKDYERLGKEVANILAAYDQSYENQIDTQTEIFKNQMLLQANFTWQQYYNTKKDDEEWINGGFMVDPEYLKYLQVTNQILQFNNNYKNELRASLYGWPYYPLGTRYQFGHGNI